MNRSRTGVSALFAAFALGVGSVPASACLVDVDEGLLDKAKAGADAARDTSAQSDAAYDGMPCGAARCQPPGQVCCAKQFGDPDIGNGVCSTRDLCESGDYFACTSPRDCVAAGLSESLCCAVHVRGAFNMTKCLSACDAMSATLCDPGGAPCASPRKCLPSPEFPKLFECVVPP